VESVRLTFYRKSRKVEGKAKKASEKAEEYRGLAPRRGVAGCKVKKASEKVVEHSRLPCDRRWPRMVKRGRRKGV
jgi:hypothetical protein